MSSTARDGRSPSGVIRRATASLAAVTLVGAGVTVAQVATAPNARAAETAITDATFTWGLNGYAQKGIFGPWSFTDPTGDAEVLTGSVSPGGTQTEYVVDPVPATSMPVSDPQKTPNAVRFSGGTGTTDPETGELDVAWDGSYTVNAYPTLEHPDGGSYAPDEIFTDPVLTLDGTGNGSLSMAYRVGPGHDMDGNPTPGEDVGRFDVLTFSEGSVTPTSLDGFRATPDYQGVVIEFDNGQGGTSPNTQCTATGNTTGWWGSFPVDFVHAVPNSVQPHFYSTGCGGNQDLKPPLPVDVDLGLATEPSVAVSDTTILPSGVYEVTVEGSGFDPALAIGTRPPLAGQPAGTYVVFGKFADSWRPSEGAPGSTRVNTSQQWAVPGASVPGTIALEEDGTFSTTLTVDKAAIDAAATDPGLTNYGVYTYPGSGAVEPAFETYTPVTFGKGSSRTRAQVVKLPKPRKPGRAKATVTAPEGDVTGAVRFVAKNAKGRKLLAKRVPLSAAGTASVRLPRLAKGRYRLTVSYGGNVNLSGSTAARAFRVR